ncbi:MAG: hypothetical protein D6702_07610 [Planctomycetota bacterium]|nr:MAG: hypothetical protein D6702_07610 [Planctomycetota bacterium]
MRATTRRILPALLLAGLAAACSTPSQVVYLHPLADLSLIKRIAVMPLGNLSSNTEAHQWVRQILNHELLVQGIFETVEPWEVNRVLLEKQIPQDGIPSLSPEQLAELGQELGAQAFLVGDVLQFEQGRYGNLTAPEIGLSLRLLDVETGIVIWSATASKSGIGFTERLVGANGPDLTAATSELVRNLLSTLST